MSDKVLQPDILIGKFATIQIAATIHSNPSDTSIDKPGLRQNFLASEMKSAGSGIRLGSSDV